MFVLFLTFIIIVVMFFQEATYMSGYDKVKLNTYIKLASSKNIAAHFV